jgi:hypothetical protein
MDRRCAHCGEIVGVYEPMRLPLPDGTDRHGSRLTLEDQLATGSTVLHERCYDVFELGRAEAGGLRGTGPTLQHGWSYGPPFERSRGLWGLSATGSRRPLVGEV